MQGSGARGKQPQTELLQNIEYEAFLLACAETRGPSFQPYPIYAGTNSDLLSVNTINSTSTHAKLAGCDYTNSVPFSWNYTLPHAGNYQATSTTLEVQYTHKRVANGRIVLFATRSKYLLPTDILQYEVLGDGNCRSTFYLNMTIH